MLGRQGTWNQHWQKCGAIEHAEWVGRYDHYQAVAKVREFLAKSGYTDIPLIVF